MHTRVTFGTNHRSLSGTDAADGFAPVHRTSELDNGWNETYRISMVCIQEKNFNLFFSIASHLYPQSYKLIAHTHI